MAKEFEKHPHGELRTEVLNWVRNYLEVHPGETFSAGQIAIALRLPNKKSVSQVLESTFLDSSLGGGGGWFLPDDLSLEDAFRQPKRGRINLNYPAGQNSVRHSSYGSKLLDSAKDANHEI
jgi:hypothetical protein